MARTTGTVGLAELLSRGTLKTGEKLLLHRRSKPPIEGTLEKDGRIRIAGEIFKSPSTAAKAALGLKAADGWLRWRVPRLGDKSLNEVRDDSVRA